MIRTICLFLRALHCENTTGYVIADVADVEKFLDLHMGERLFHISA